MERTAAGWRAAVKVGVQVVEALWAMVVDAMAAVVERAVLAEKVGAGAASHTTFLRNDRMEPEYQPAVRSAAHAFLLLLYRTGCSRRVSGLERRHTTAAGCASEGSEGRRCAGSLRTNLEGSTVEKEVPVVVGRKQQ